jgi:tetratricopeptide (TPR) repeat protein
MSDNPRIADLRRRVLADPASIAFAALAEEYRRMGNYAEAIETCRVGLQRHPSYLSARVTLGRALMETAQYDDARQELELVLKRAPENLAAIRALAEIHERQRSLPEHDAIVVPAAREAEPEPAAIAVTVPAPSQVAVAEPAAAAVIEKPLEAPEPVAVRQIVPALAAPALAAVLEVPAKAGGQENAKAESRNHPAIAGLEQFLAAIQSARASLRVSA